MVDKQRVIPLIVATALFMENMDSTVIATSLPAIAADIGTSPLTLKLAITSYLLSLAVFIPASGWTADRFGARMVFAIAVGVFMVGSIGCALSTSVTDFVFARILQGMGGAMMTPVGRLVLLRSVDKSALVNAMAWVTVPALIGPVIGPPLGGFITTYASWHWIFLINIPIGLLGIFMALRFIDPIKSEEREPFDLYGMVLAGLGARRHRLRAVGCRTQSAAMEHGCRPGRRRIDLDDAVCPSRAANGIAGARFHAAEAADAARGHFRRLHVPARHRRAAVPVAAADADRLRPVAVQVRPRHVGSSLGAMGMKALAARIIRTFGFRNLMTVNAIISAVFLAACALFTVTTPLLIIMIILVVGGFFRSLEFTAINTVAYAEVEHAQMSRATTLVSVNQQLAVSAGVAVGAASVETTMWFSHASELDATVFAPAFVVIALTSAASSWFFWQMPADAGHEVSGRKAVEIASRKGAGKGAAKAAVKAATEDTQDVRDQRLG